MDNPLISIIVPVYKVEAYLNKCISSIVNQTYQDLEIILVDDGSPDGCPAICDAWAEKDSRIKVIHKPNGGLSDARNAGMTIATGELMGFVDSDDWISPDMYQILYESMTDSGSDIAACGVEMVWEDGTLQRRLTNSGCCVLDREAAMRALIEESWLKQPVWYKLYKTDLIRDIAFPVGKYHEDVFWSYQAIGRADKVSVIDTVGYYYLQRSGSIMGESYSIKRLDALAAREQRLSYIQENFPALAGEEKKSMLFFCMYSMQMAMRYLSKEDLKAAEVKIRQVIQERQLVRDLGALTKRQSLWTKMAKISLKRTCQLRNMLGIGL